MVRRFGFLLMGISTRKGRAAGSVEHSERERACRICVAGAVPGQRPLRPMPKSPWLCERVSAAGFPVVGNVAVVVGVSSTKEAREPVDDEAADEGLFDLRATSAPGVTICKGGTRANADLGLSELRPELSVSTESPNVANAAAVAWLAERYRELRELGAAHASPFCEDDVVLLFSLVADDGRGLFREPLILPAADEGRGLFLVPMPFPVVARLGAGTFKPCPSGPIESFVDAMPFPVVARLGAGSFKPCPSGPKESFVDALPIAHQVMFSFSSGIHSSSSMDECMLLASV